MVDRKSGLSDSEVEKRLEIHGLNELEKHEGPFVFHLILDQFNDTLVRILLVAAMISFVLACNAEKALQALKEIQSEHATVICNGRIVSGILAKELVPGDIVELRVGDKVHANMRVLTLISSTLRVENGSLTGESEISNIIVGEGKTENTCTGYWG
ncbi:hypothetical protein L2E82_06253 [Cichorium intybus]|uniref:Uncharacterized protein n=1 Tax=Cichorium intybus TaxID=13427 RepID=A0ACB9HAM8_CICIN|nr:hypothetical protein L2E82_06253 [Cichorium intybus]